MVKEVAFAEAYAMVLGGRITDIILVAAVLKARLLWKDLSLLELGEPG